MSTPASHPRPLPIRPRPAAGESTASYIARLAQANHLRPRHLYHYLRDTEAGSGAVRLDRLAALAGRTPPALERALTDPARRRADLFARIRHDAHHQGLSIRALAGRHGVTRPTVRQALASPTPAPRKKPPPRASRLDPYKDAIDAILRSDSDTPTRPPHTIRQVHDRLETEHGMAGVSYTVVRNYIRRNHRGTMTDQGTSRR